MNKYALYGKLKAKVGKVEELKDILLQASHLVSTAKGCHLYTINRDPKEPDSITVMEIWDNKEDHDNSLTIEGCRELISKAMPLLDGAPEGVTLEVIGGHGIK